MGRNNGKNLINSLPGELWSSWQASKRRWFPRRQVCSSRSGGSWCGPCVTLGCRMGLVRGLKQQAGDQRSGVSWELREEGLFF